MRKTANILFKMYFGIELISPTRSSSVRKNYTTVSRKSVASLGMVTPGAEFHGVTLHRLYFKECIVGNVYYCTVGRKRLYFKDGCATSLL